MISSADIAGGPGKVLAILVYSDRAFVEAVKLMQSGITPLIGLRDGELRDDSLWERCREVGLEAVNIWDAVGKADIIQVW